MSIVVRITNFLCSNFFLLKYLILRIVEGLPLDFLALVTDPFISGWTYWVLFFLVNVRLYRGSHERCSMKKVVIRNFTKFTGKHLCQSLFFNKVAGRGPGTGGSGTGVFL